MHRVGSREDAFACDRVSQHFLKNKDGDDDDNVEVGVEGGKEDDDIILISVGQN